MPISRRSLSSSFSLLLLVGCEFFGPTVIPASDTSKPWAVVALHYDGDHQLIDGGTSMSLQDAATGEAFHHVTSQPWKSFIALSAGMDGGGTREVQMHSRITVRCTYGPADLRVLEPWTQQTATQSGSPGDTVEDGLYVFKGFRGGDWHAEVDALDDFCSDESYQVTLSWHSRVRDFHGNWSFYGQGKVTYVRWAG